MKRHLLALIYVCAAVGALAASNSSSSSLAWRRFKSEHAKVYGPEENEMRFANFLETKQLVERHNANPNATYKMGLNHMADWTRDEKQQLTGTKLSGTQRGNNDDSLSPELAKLLNGPVPDEVDWRKVPNRVSAVKDQGNCTSGWAFATTGLLEGQQALLNISGLIPLSEQQLVSCSQNNHGCSNGKPQDAIYDIRVDLNGIESEADYPYEAKESNCTMDKSKSVMNPTGCYLLKTDENILSYAVANYGPVAVSIFATKNFLHYSTGVLDDYDCYWDSTANVNHHVLVVGYGTDPKLGDYWLLKNSWGTKWGEEGYIRMRRGINLCAIADSALVAVF